MRADASTKAPELVVPTAGPALAPAGALSGFPDQALLRARLPCDHAQVRPPGTRGFPVGDARPGALRAAPGRRAVAAANLPARARRPTRDGGAAAPPAPPH